MGLENCQIYLDNTSAIYFPGQTVSGKVEFNFNSKKKIRGVSISFKGEAHVQWSESESYRQSGKTKHRSVTYRGNEEYFSNKYYVLGGANNDSMELPSGKHVFPFSTVLPNFLPSSFEGDKGYIRYTVKATLDRPWKFDQSIKAAYTVISHLDCNSNPRAREPATMTMEKFLCCLCCREGPITGVLKLPYTGYVSGQVIPYIIEVDNASKTPVDYIKMKLKKHVSYHSRIPRSRTKHITTDVAEFVISSQKVPGQTSKTFTNSFKLPALPPSNLQNCHIIDLQYELKIEFEIDLHKNMVGQIPIMIGTIPLTNMVIQSPVPRPERTNVVSDAQTVDRNPLLGWNPGSSNSAPTAPMDASLLPPPTYEECQYGTKSILDSSDSEYTKFNKDRCYAPSYPVYNFNSVPMPAEGSSTMPVPVHVPVPTVSNVSPSAPPI